MGMFDNLYFDGREYQTKDTPAQMLDNYKIENGQLWHENYECEWVKDESRFGGGYIKQFNQRWELCSDFDGVIRFYRDDGGKWIEYKTVFIDGKLVKIKQIEEENGSI